MAQRAQARRHPAVAVAPRSAVGQKDKVATSSGGFAALLESAMQEILAVTYWFDPAQHTGTSTVTVRFSGRRANVKGRLSPGDKFVQDETIEKVVPGSGPIALTARVSNINPGEWIVSAHILGAAHAASELKQQLSVAPAAEPRHPIARFWRRWAPPVESDEHVKTCLTLLAHIPGIFPGIWGAMATLGMIVAVVLQALVIAANRLALGPWWMVTLAAIAVGIAGAKGWYIVLKRREHLRNGWCIQGFILGATLTAATLLVALGVPVGAFLDAAAPGLLVAMAVGRVGCFFAGCCGGRPTASRFGVWSSDQRVGARRIPTQLLESELAGILGLGALVAVLSRGPAGGAFFALGLSAYVLGRQGILRLRAEPRKTRLGGPLIAALAALVLIAAVVLLVR